LNKPNVFASKPSFTQRAVLHKNCNCVIRKHHVLHKNHVLAGPVQGLFAAYRIALSMVAGGTRRRRLNNTNQRFGSISSFTAALILDWHVQRHREAAWL
jgi:hypothetical protein